MECEKTDKGSYEEMFVYVCPKYKARTLTDQTKTTVIHIKFKSHLTFNQQSQAKVLESS